MAKLGTALDAAALGELRASVGDDPDFLAELVAEFLDDAPTQLEALREALVSGDAGGARRAAHTLKGNGSTFGARGLASLCQEAEAAAGAGDLDAVRALVDGLEGEWARVRTALVPLRDGRA